MKLKYLILLLLPFSVMADGWRQSDTINNYEYVTNNYETVETSKTFTYDNDDAIALAIATYHPFDYATLDWQASVNTGAFESEYGISFGIAKRFDGLDALFHSSYGQSSSLKAFTFGAVWRFE